MKGPLRIGALQKTTLLDFPGKVSALVFTQGCNFHCPYCHNPDLLCPGESALSPEEVLDFLRLRRHVLQGVVISGGEPTLHAPKRGLEKFCTAAKALGYAVKLDTNGSNPQALRELLHANLLDYVALDIKADPHAYPASLCPAETAKGIAQSIALLRNSGIAHEFRVTCVAPFVTPQSFHSILDALTSTKENTHAQAPAPMLFLQAARLEHALSPDFFPHQGHALSQEEIAALAAAAEARGVICSMR